MMLSLEKIRLGPPDASHLLASDGERFTCKIVFSLQAALIIFAIDFYLSSLFPSFWPCLNYVVKGRRQKKGGTFGWWGPLGRSEARPQLSAKKVPLFIFAFIRCRSLQNV